MRRIAIVVSLLLGGGLTLACGGAAPIATTSPAAPPAEAPPPARNRETRPLHAGSPIDLDCGDFSTCAVVEGGRVRCWGRNKAGELGDGGGADTTKGIEVPGIENATRLALASQFGCALLTDKQVKCWGTGRIANDGATKERAAPTVVRALSGVEELVASGAIACARSATAVTCWGSDATTIGVPPRGSFTHVAAGFTHACALDKKGAAVCWGEGEWSAKGAFSKPGVSGATQIATGDRHACVVTKDKHVQCWGLNDAGQLGSKPDGNAHRTALTVPGVSGVAKLVAGESATCAILADGSAQCWGANAEGELGLGRKSAEERPVKLAALPPLANMCLATSHGCALTKDRRVVCWGANAAGQLGIGTKDAKLEPAPVIW